MLEKKFKGKIFLNSQLIENTCSFKVVTAIMYYIIIVDGSMK